MVSRDSSVGAPRGSSETRILEQVEKKLVPPIPSLPRRCFAAQNLHFSEQIPHSQATRVPSTSSKSKVGNASPYLPN